MKKIDAHAHIGYIGGWADVGITEEGLIEQMDQFDIDRTALCCEDNQVTLKVMEDFPGRFIGCVYVCLLYTSDARILCGWGNSRPRHGKGGKAGAAGMYTQWSSSLFIAVADRSSC